MSDFPLPATNPSSPLSDLANAHLCIRVPNYGAAKRWYTETLDFRVVTEWPFGGMELGYFAAPEDNNTIVEIIGGGDAPITPKAEVTDLMTSLSSAGVHHYCFTVKSVEESVEQLRKRGVRIVAEPFVLDDINRRLAFFADPFGNLYELSERLVA